MACGHPISLPGHPAIGCPTSFQSWVHIVWTRIRWKSKTDTKKAHRWRHSYFIHTETYTTESTDMIAVTEIGEADEDLFKQLSPDDAYLSCKY